MTTTLQSRQTPEQFQAEANFCTTRGLELELATDYGWIVRSANSDHVGHVIGCIDQLPDCVELLRLDGGFHWSTYPHLHDALVNLTAQPQQDHNPTSPWGDRHPVGTREESMAS